MYNFKIYNQSELKFLGSKLKRDITSWSQDWLGDESVDVEVINAFDCPALLSGSLLQKNEVLPDSQQVWFDEELFLSSVSRKWFSCTGKVVELDKYLETASEQCLAEFKNCLLVAGEQEDCVEKQAFCHVGSGWAVVTVNFLDESFKFLLDQKNLLKLLELMDYSEEEKECLACFSSVVPDEEVTLNVDLCEFKLTLHEFMSLKPGDVVMTQAIITGLD